MSFDPGQLDRIVTLMRAEPVDDGLQDRLSDPKPIGTFYASRRDVSDAERFAGGAIRATVTTRFQARWSRLTAAIRTSDTLVCEGRVYEIVGLKEIGRRFLIEISARTDI